MTPDRGPVAEDANYFEVELTHKEWSVDVPYYRRPVSAIVEPVIEAGFRIERFVEPRPTDAFEQKWPERYEKESKRPLFLCVRAVKE